MAELAPGEPIVKIGEVIEGRYKIIQPLGEGGTGAVFLAEHWLIKRRVALKVLHREFASDADMIRRFMNEALAAGTLGHPNIVESTDMGFTKNDVPYIVFEYVEGTLLSDEIDKHKSIPVIRTLAIVQQIASALRAAHEAGIVHRDLKAENVLIGRRAEAVDHVKVLDFGISRFLEARDRTKVGGDLIGTPEYMAPEQILTPDAVDHRADIYALGVLLYEMLSGAPPFHFAVGAVPIKAGRAIDIEKTHALLHRIIHEPPPPLRHPEAPEGLCELIVDQLLAKDREKRPQSMTEVQRALDRIGNVPRVSASFAIIADEPPPRAARRTSTAADLDLVSDQTLTREKLAPTELVREIKMLGRRWSLASYNVLRLELYHRKLTNLAAVITQAALVGDELEHRPRFVVDYPKLVLEIRAYAGDEIGVMDLVFAARLEQWLRDQGW